MKQAIWKTYNPATKRHEEIVPSQVRPGQTIVVMYWSVYASKYMTVPGASLYKVNATGQMELISD